MIYTTGTLSVSNSNQLVTGTGTSWLTRLVEGAIIYIDGSGKPYYVANILSDTQLYLTTNFQEATKTDVTYLAIHEFTLNYSYPYPLPHDVENSTIMNRSLSGIDTDLAGIDARVYEIENPSGVFPEDLSVVPSIGTVSIPVLHNLFLSTIRSTPRIAGIAVNVGYVPENVVTADASDVTADANTVTADGSYTAAQGLVRASSATVTTDSSTKTIDGGSA